MRVIEAGGRARAVGKCSNATARKRGDNAEGRDETDPVVV
jgi:hypothetical protein